MTNKKKFHISDILSVTTGKLVTTRKMDGLYDILNFMTNDNLFTHQLPRAYKECKPYLLEQIPELKDVSGKEVTEDNWKEWLEEQIEKFGEYREIESLPEGVHEYIDPITEAIEMMNKK